MGRRITKQDLIRYVAGGRLPRNVREEINRQVKIIGSPIHKWVAAADAKIQDPLAVDWEAVAVFSDESPPNRAMPIEQLGNSEHKVSIQNQNHRSRAKPLLRVAALVGNLAALILIAFWALSDSDSHQLPARALIIANRSWTVFAADERGAPADVRTAQGVIQIPSDTDFNVKIDDPPLGFVTIVLLTSDNTTVYPRAGQSAIRIERNGIEDIPLPSPAAKTALFLVITERSCTDLLRTVLPSNGAPLDDVPRILDAITATLADHEYKWAFVSHRFVAPLTD